MSATLTLHSQSASRFFAGSAMGAAQGAQTQPARDGLAVDSHALLQGHKAVTIVHNGALYRLQSTKLGKLILTK